MFVQILRGRATDADALKHQLDTWYDELSPAATGWLGSTGGVTDDGSFIASFRFETQEAAQTNSDRSEQTQWWKERRSPGGDGPEPAVGTPHR